MKNKIIPLNEKELKRDLEFLGEMKNKITPLNEKMMNISGCISRMACEEDIQETLKNIKEELGKNVHDRLLDLIKDPAQSKISIADVLTILETETDKSFLKHVGEFK